MLCSRSVSKIENGTENNIENIIMSLCKLMLNQQVKCCELEKLEKNSKYDHRYNIITV